MVQYLEPVHAVRDGSHIMTPDPTDSNPFDGAISTAEDFDDALRELVLTALDNDVDPTGSWVARNGSGTPDFEIEVYELAKDQS